jgi:hypothetical protein
MSSSTTADLKCYLKGRTRRRVGHPEKEGAEVRVEDVTREFWSYRQDGELRVCRFSEMGGEQIERILAGGAE